VALRVSLHRYAGLHITQGDTIKCPCRKIDVKSDDLKTHDIKEDRNILNLASVFLICSLELQGLRRSPETRRWL